MELKQKEENLKYIKQFMKISIKNVCLDLKVDYSNVLKGTASDKVIDKVKKELERRINIIKEK